MFLATINPATGQVTTPSYYRPGSTTRRRTELDHQPGQVHDLATAAGGHGAWLPGLRRQRPTSKTGARAEPGRRPGGNDSIWIDIGAPELTTATGIRYKMLVAPLILDLDSDQPQRGRQRPGHHAAPDNAHASNQGWGPWEVNIGKVLNAELSLPLTNGRTSSSATRPPDGHAHRPLRRQPAADVDVLRLNGVGAARLRPGRPQRPDNPVTPGSVTA